MSNYFIKKYNSIDMSTQKGREKFGYVTCWIAVFCQLALFCVKLMVGMLIGSIAVIADSVNSLSDAGSTTVTLLSFKLSGKPADKEHPFGHARIEYIAAIIVAFIIFILGYEFIQTSIQKIIHPEPLVFELPVAGLLIIAMLTSLFLSRFLRYAGRKIDSQPLTASSKDAFYDFVTTFVILAASLVSKYTGIMLDGYAGVFISLMLFKCSIGIALDAISPLLGEPASKQTGGGRKKIIESYDGIIRTHDLIVHSYGPYKTIASIHAEVPSGMSLPAGHKIVDRAEREVYKKLGIDLLIHMDPIDVNDEQTNRLKLHVFGVIDSEDGVSAHDFRVLRGSDRPSFIFDLVFPHSYENQKQAEILNNITVKINECGYICKINCENSYTE